MSMQIWPEPRWSVHMSMTMSLRMPIHMSMHISIQMPVHMSMCACLYTGLYPCSGLHACAYACLCTCLYAHLYTRRYTCVYARPCACLHTCPCAHQRTTRSMNASFCMSARMPVHAMSLEAHSADAVQWPSDVGTHVRMPIYRHTFLNRPSDVGTHVRMPIYRYMFIDRPNDVGTHVRKDTRQGMRVHSPRHRHVCRHVLRHVHGDVRTSPWRRAMVTRHYTVMAYIVMADIHLPGGARWSRGPFGSRSDP